MSSSCPSESDRWQALAVPTTESRGDTEEFDVRRGTPFLITSYRSRLFCCSRASRQSLSPPPVPWSQMCNAVASFGRSRRQGFTEEMACSCSDSGESYVPTFRKSPYRYQPWLMTHAKVVHHSSWRIQTSEGGPPRRSQRATVGRLSFAHAFADNRSFQERTVCYGLKSPPCFRTAGGLLL
jgi:hypothetical protein